MTARSPGETRRQVPLAEGDRHAELEQAGGLAAARADLGLGLVHLRQQLLAARVEHLALAGERQASCRAVQQTHAQAGFQVFDVAADGGGTDVEFQLGCRHAERRQPRRHSPARADQESCWSARS